MPGESQMPLTQTRGLPEVYYAHTLLCWGVISTVRFLDGRFFKQHFWTEVYFVLGVSAHINFGSSGQS